MYGAAYELTPALMHLQIRLFNKISSDLVSEFGISKLNFQKIIISNRYLKSI